MRWSYYNIESEISESKEIAIYNTLTQSLVVLDRKSLDELKNQGSSENKQLEQILIKNKILVTDDNLEKIKIKIKILKGRFEQRFLDMTILPTYLCNFRCDYCFEKSINNETIISDYTIENIIGFIKSFPVVEDLCIKWYGGEPTLALKQIEAITKKVKKLGKNYYSVLITNGYLLDKLTPPVIERLKIKVIQVTIDGQANSHNERRQHKNDKETYHRILQNVMKILENSEKIRVAIRVNIDKSNSPEYIGFIEEMRSSLPSSQVDIIPGFVTSFSEKCNAKAGCYVNPLEKINFLLDSYKKLNDLHPYLIPRPASDGCLARHLNSFVIDPHGDIYKCMAVVGVTNNRIGNVNEDKWLKNEDVLAKFLKDGDFLDNITCNNCQFFPICSEGCLLSKEDFPNRCEAVRKTTMNFIEQQVYKYVNEL